MDMNELLNKAKTRANLPSDYALAKALGLSRGWISEYRKGKRHPGNEVAVQLATLAGLDEMRVIAEIELLTAKTEKKQSFWKCYLEQRGITAALCLIAVGASIMLTPSRTDADVLHLQNMAKIKASFHERKKTIL